MRNKKELKCNIEEIFNSIPEIIIEFDLNWNFIYLSHLSFHLFGFHPHELVRVNLLKFIHPEDLLRIQSDMKYAIFFKKDIYIEFRIRKKNGTYLPISMNVACRKIKEKTKFLL